MTRVEELSVVVPSNQRPQRVLSPDPARHGALRSSMFFAATVTAMIAARVAVMALDWSVF